MDVKTIDLDIEQLQQKLGDDKLSPDQLEKVRYAMADYALAATIDSEVQKEAEQIACGTEA